MAKRNQKQRKVSKTLTAEWEVLSMADWLLELGREPTNEELCEIYKGEFFPMYLTRLVAKEQIWNLTIKTTLEHNDGTICNHEMRWAFDKPMSMHEVLNGAKHVKIERDGFKVSWVGVIKQWLKELDAEFDNEWLTTRADVVATCKAELTAKSLMADRFARLVAGV